MILREQIGLAVLTTKRRVIAQVFVCQGCCCGQVERGRPEVPVGWLKQEWRKRGVLKRVQLSVSGCLGPCDVPNVVAIVTQTKTVWLGNISRRDQYQSLYLRLDCYSFWRFLFWHWHKVISNPHRPTCAITALPQT